jgi:hypothetical protein
MTITTSDGLTIDLEENDVCRWFMAVDIAQAQDTLNVVRGIIETRQAMQPKRARRKDAGKPRSQAPLDLKELTK